MTKSLKQSNRNECCNETQRTPDPPQDESTFKFTLRFWMGIVLLTTNQPIGWAALAICNTLAIQKCDIFFTYLGCAFYALTWGMLGLGVVLAGPEGIRYSRLLIKRVWTYLMHLFTLRKV